MADLNAWTNSKAFRQGTQPPAVCRIDPAAGNDSAVGDAAAPLRSWAAFRARYEGMLITADTTVQIVSALSEAVEGTFRLGSAGFLRVTGRTFETVVYTSAGTAVTTVAMNAAGNAVLVITDAAVVDWAPFVGKRIRWTSGALNGAVAWIMNRTLGATIAEISTPMLWNDLSAGLYTLPGSPANGDTFVVENLVLIDGANLVFSSPNGSSTAGFSGFLRACLDSLDVNASGTSETCFVSCPDGFSAAVSRSSVSAIFAQGQRPVFAGCGFPKISNISNVGSAGNAFALACHFPVGMAYGAGVILDGHSISNGSVLPGGQNCLLQIGGFALQGAAVWRFAGSAFALLDGAVLQVLGTSLLWGANNTRGVSTTTKGVTLIYQTTKPIITGTTSDTRFWNRDIAWAAYPAGTTRGQWITYPVDLQVQSTGAPYTAASAADTLVTSMTITPPAGRYTVEISGSIVAGIASTATVDIWAGGVLVAGTQRDAIGLAAATLGVPFAAVCDVEVNGSQAIEMRMRTTGAVNATINDRSLVLKPVC